jgi:hypothetical protein
LLTPPDSKLQDKPKEQGATMHIISNSRNFSFLHIPKNGGTSIFSSLSSINDRNARYAYRTEHLGDLGPVKMSHLPLFAIRDFFPEDYESIYRSNAFALLRDPTERFKSSLAQRVKERKRSIDKMSQDEIGQDVDEVITALSREPDVPSYEFCHFIRQSDFVSVDGQRIVKNLFPIEFFEIARERISQASGVSVQSGVKNKRRVIRDTTTVRMARRAWQGLKPLLPERQRKFLWNMSYRAVTEPLEAKNIEVLNSRYVRDFISSYYSNDDKMHKEILSEFHEGAGMT